MKLKTLIVTVLALAVVSAIVFFVNRPAPLPSADPRLGQPVLAPAMAENAGKVKISDQGKTVELAKQSDGSWKVTSYYDFPADFQKLSTFVGDLTSAKIEQLVTSNPERLNRLEFKDTRIELLDSGDKSLLLLTLGKNAEAGGRFLRYNDEKKGYRANLNVWLDAESKNWADASLVPVKVEDVAKVEFDFPNAAPVVVSRAKKEDSFTTENPPAGQKLKGDKVSSVLSSITSLRFSDTNDPQDPNAVAAKQNERSVKVTTFAGKTWTVALGRKPEQKIVKAPTPGADNKSGPAALGSVKDADKPAPAGDAAQIAKPETETVPAGPVFAFISSSDAQAPINSLMTKRAFQVYEYAFTSLPEKRDDLFEAAPPPPPPANSAQPATPSAPPASAPAATPPPTPAAK